MKPTYNLGLDKQIIVDYVSNLKLGKEQQYKNMSLTPLLGDSAQMKYLTFDEALKKGLVVYETGTVQNLDIVNNTGKKVLIMQGEYITGGKQNRMVSQSALISKGENGTSVNIPVNCVQQHRWDQGAPNFHAKSPKRATRGVFYASAQGQHAVWDEVQAMASFHNVNSNTANFDDIFQQKQEDITDYMKNFSYEKGSVGVLVGTNIGGRTLYSVDIFNKDKSMKKNFDKIIESYALEALNRSSKAPLGEKEHIITELLTSMPIAGKSVDLGEYVKLQSNKESGHAVIYKNSPVYINFSTQVSNGPTIRPPIFEPFGNNYVRIRPTRDSDLFERNPLNDIRMKGLDDTMTTEEIQKAIAEDKKKLKRK